jgi:hypothetical protein
MSYRHRAAPPRRAGVILLIVVIMLALFAVVGLSFILYAESEATASRVYRESQAVTIEVADIPPQDLLNYALSQLVYDVSDGGTDVYSALRGHSLARLMYGFNYVAPAGPTHAYGNTNPLLPVGLNNATAFNGLGALRTNPAPFGMSDFDLPNYTCFAIDGFIRDPERVGVRAGPQAEVDNTTHTYAGGANVPYTFPDRNNMFLSGVKMHTDPNGTYPYVLVPSFVRPNPQFGVADDPHRGTLHPLNPAWTTPPGGPGYDPAWKYMVLRPRPGDHAGFPPPADEGGDVKNLPSALGCDALSVGHDTNDSYWMDLGYLVTTTRGGRKFKPMFAFLVLDLDNRVNVNVHGNVKGAGNQHASDQGLGAHEVNLGQVITGDPAELANLFVGRAPNYGRYASSSDPPSPTPGSNPKPGPYNNSDPAAGASYPDPYTVSATTGLPRRSYLAALDFDAVDDTDGDTITSKFRLPQANGYQSFPTFTGGYDIVSAAAVAGHPLLYNADRPIGDTTFKDGDNMYHLLGPAGNLVNRANLFNLIPNNFTIAANRFRHLITTRSYDLETPGAMPWSDYSQAAAIYSLPVSSDVPNAPFPTGGGAVTTNPVNGFSLPAVNNLGNLPAGSDFIPGDGRAQLLSRLDLGRRLTSFYDPNTNTFTMGTPPSTPGGEPPQVPGYYRAMWERQQFAGEILARLIRATGAVPLSQLGSASPDQQSAVRYLAQLAVNIVDVIDDDDIITPFNWFGSEFVYGTEVPKVAINEVYGEMRNAKNDNNPVTGATKPFRVNFWIELYNPHPPAGVVDPETGQDRAAAQLQRPGYAAYQIQFVDEAQSPRSDLRKVTNADGHAPKPVDAANPPRQNLGTYDFTNRQGTPEPGADATVIRPNDGTVGPGLSVTPAQSNRGFYVLGPEDQNDPLSQDFESGNPALKPTYRSRTLTYEVPVATSVPRQPTYTILLRRLAVPYLPPDPVPGSPTYNPYVTIDYVTGVTVTDVVAFPKNSNPLVPLTPRPEYGAQRQSRGRPQPYRSVSLALPPPADPEGDATTAQTGAGSPQNTFFKHNSNAPQAGSPPAGFDWLVHLDRAPLSVAELLHVSGFKPHELTQRFRATKDAVVPDPQPHPVVAHNAPWAPIPAAGGYTPEEVNHARLYRALEFFTVGDRTYRASGGRRPGKININTAWDYETFKALCDAQPNSNYFSDADVKEVWDRLQARRTLALGGTNTSENSPLLGFAAPAVASGSDQQYPDGAGVQDTILGDVSTSPQLPGPQPPNGPHPYVAAELLTKVANNVTTRSNVFAVFLTVGFFEVADDSVQPVKLGPEVRQHNGIPIRHRMFAIVDRTNLGAKPPSYVSATGVSPNPDLVSGAWRQLQSDTPPIFLTCLNSVPSNSATAWLSIEGGIPTSYNAVGTTVTGMNVVNDNLIVTINLNDVLYVDTGAIREPVRVVQITRPATATDPVQIGVQFLNESTWGAANSRFAHPAGFTITNVLPSNPGPQGSSFDVFNKQNYAPVVPYKLIIQ